MNQAAPAHVSRGIGSEITLESLNTFIKTYKYKTRNLPAAARPGDAEELQMMVTIAYKDPGIREL